MVRCAERLRLLFNGRPVGRIGHCFTSSASLTAATVNLPVSKDNSLIAFYPFGEFVERIERYLKKRGLRMTRQRRAIAKAVFEFQGSFTAEQLASTFQQSNHQIGRATVYRTLRELSTAGFLAEVQSEGVTLYCLRVIG